MLRCLDEARIAVGFKEAESKGSFLSLGDGVFNLDTGLLRKGICSIEVDAKAPSLHLFAYSPSPSPIPLIWHPLSPNQQVWCVYWGAASFSERRFYILRMSAVVLGCARARRAALHITTHA
jgi:hypothetical protein